MKKIKNLDNYKTYKKIYVISGILTVIGFGVQVLKGFDWQLTILSTVFALATIASFFIYNDGKRGN